MRRLIAVVMSLLVLGVAVTIFVRASHAKRPEPARPFVVTFSVSKLADGKIVQDELQTKLVKATGEYKLTRYFLNRATSYSQVGTSEGVFDVGEASLDFVGAPGPAEREEAFRSARFHKTHPEFVRTESLIGYLTYVHRAQDDSGTWLETYFAPEIGLTPLKTVMHMNSGEELIIEAINVQFREVSNAEVAPPSLPISFDVAASRIDEMQTSGNRKAADMLSKQVVERKALARPAQ